MTESKRIFYNHPVLGVVEIHDLEPVFEGNDDGLFRAKTLDKIQILVTATRFVASPTSTDVRSHEEAKNA